MKSLFGKIVNSSKIVLFLTAVKVGGSVVLIKKMYSLSPSKSSGYNFPAPQEPLRDTAGRSLLSEQLFALDRLVSSLPDRERDTAIERVVARDLAPALVSVSGLGASRASHASTMAAYAARPPGASYLSTEPEMLRVTPLPRKLLPQLFPQLLPAAPVPTFAPPLPPLPPPPPAIASFGDSEWRARLHARVDAPAAEAASLVGALRAGADFRLVAPGAADSDGISVRVRALADLSALELASAEGDVFLVPIAALSGVEFDAPHARLRLLPAAAGAATAELVASDVRLAADWVAGVALLAALAIRLG